MLSADLSVYTQIDRKIHKPDIIIIYLKKNMTYINTIFQNFISIVHVPHPLTAMLINLKS